MILRVGGMLAVLFVFGSLSVAALQPSNPPSAIVRGWLSDEGCARGRASSGVYTGTNPDCARQCVAQGKKIVLIDPAAKVILNIANQDVAKKNIGDYVEATGALDPQTKTLRINSVKMLAPGKAMCSLPQPAK
jgi:hypothetical protein